MALRESPAAVVNRGEQDAPSQQWDRFGALASGLCAVHCAATALAPALFVLAGLELLLSESAEWTFTALALLFASGALLFGWRRHRSVPVASVFALGILGLLLSRGLEMRAHHDHAHEVSHHGAARLVPRRTPDHDGAGSQDGHGLGAWFGLVAGAFLVGGHALNIRASRGPSGSGRARALDPERNA